MSKYVFLLFAITIVGCSSAVLPAAYVANYATSYNAHVVNHALAAPLTSYVAPAAPLVAAPAAPLVAAPAAPLIAAHAAPFVAAAPLQAYSVHPY